MTAALLLLPAVPIDAVGRAPPAMKRIHIINIFIFVFSYGPFWPDGWLIFTLFLCISIFYYYYAFLLLKVVFLEKKKLNIISSINIFLNIYI